MDKQTKVRVGKGIRAMIEEVGIPMMLEVVRYDRPGLFRIVAREIAAKLFYDRQDGKTLASQMRQALDESERWHDTDRRRSELWVFVVIEMDEIQARLDTTRR